MTTAPRRTHRLRPIHFVLSLLLALGGVFAVAAPAHAAVDTIAGTVTTPASTPGIAVFLSQELGGSGPAFDGTTPVTATDANGDFAFTGVANGDYLLVIDGGDDWVQFATIVSVDGVVTPTPELVDLEPGVAIYGTVRDAKAPFSPLPNIIVFAGSSSSAFPVFDWLTMNLDLPSPFGGTPLTGPSGAYRFVVPIDDTYEVSAVDLSSTYADQSWYHHNLAGGCGCDFDPIVIPDLAGWPHLPIMGTDFDLLAYDDWLWFALYAGYGAGPTSYAGVHVFLELDSSGIGVGPWTVEDDGFTDSDGYLDLYSQPDGDYRLRFQIGGVDVGVISAIDPCSCGTYALAEGGKKVLIPAMAKSSGSSYFEGADVDLTFSSPATGGGGSTTTVKPRKPRVPGVATFALPTPTSTPTPTPTSTPSPAPSQTSGPSPSPTPTVDPVPTQNPLDLWWLWLLLLLIVALIVFFIIRAILRR